MNPKPKHIAFILDGNRRWAKQNRHSMEHSYKKGVETAETMLEHCASIGVATVTLYTFSSENWKRSEAEKNIIFNLSLEAFSRKIDRLIERETKIRVLGNPKLFPKRIQEFMQEAEHKTKHFSANTLQIAMGYGGRNEVVRGIQRVVDDHEKGLLNAKNLSEEQFNNYLDTSGAADPDLLIRTGGELRLSNFLLYQIAYTELYFTKTLWPDFTTKDLDDALENYSKRERHYGR